MNELMCGDCVHYHPQERGSAVGLREVKTSALCKEKTIYHEGAANVPDGAKTTKEPISKPFVVTRDMVVTHCEHARRA